MPYDKGDFTQQGVDGKVCGGLLLNNKRDVDVLVSTNEDDSTLGGIAVTVEDHLNDLKYAFFGENLEAGEVYEIGASGGGGLENPILTITFNNTMRAAAGTPYYYAVDNDNKLIRMYKELLGNSETVFNTRVPIYRSEDEEDFALWECNSLASVLSTITASNEVNCSLYYNVNSRFEISLDDPTENASITITFTNP